MKEYILTFEGNGKSATFRKLLSPELVRFTLLSIGKTDKHGVKLVSAEPVEINVRHEILSHIASANHSEAI